MKRKEITLIDIRFYAITSALTGAFTSTDTVEDRA